MQQKSEIEVVVFAVPAPLKLQLSLADSKLLTDLVDSFPSTLKLACQGLQASRYGKRLNANELISPGEQIAWLPPVSFDPKLSRQARVEKQRRDKRRLRVQAFQAASLLAKSKKG